MFRPHLLMFSRSYIRQGRIRSITVQTRRNCTISIQLVVCNVQLYLREQVLQVCFYAEPCRTAAAGKTRAMRHLPHPADLIHQLLLPPLPLPRFRSGRRDLQLVLFIYGEGGGFGRLLMRLFISALAHSIHNCSQDFSDSLSEFKSPKKV